MSRNRFIAFSLLLDTIFVVAGFLLAFLVQFGPSFWMGESARNFAAYVAIAPFITLAYLAAGWVYGLYEPERTETAWSVVRTVVLAAFIGTILTAAIAFLGSIRTVALPRMTLPWAWGIVSFLLVAWRLAFLHFGRIRWPEQRTILVGTTPLAFELAAELEARKQWGWRVCGMVCAGAECEQQHPTGPPLLGDAHDVASIARQQDANRIIVVSPIALRELVESLVLADELRVRVDVVPELYEIFIGSVDTQIGDIPLMKITSSSVPRYYHAAKRAIDLVGALVLLILVSPILLLAALGIILTDGFPVLFTQERTGLNLKPFNVYKMRSMVKDAEKLSGPVFAEEEDPRITRVGRFLRRYRVDELPQLINILKGEMSFVGPRPERPYFVDEFVKDIPGYRERFRVKPGVTGLAQVSGGYATTPERKLKYDLIYMFHQDLAMDAQIVVETLRVVLTGRGAR